MKKALFLIIGLLALPSFPPQGMADPPLAEAWADLSAEVPLRGTKVDDFTLSGYTEVGKRSTAEDYEEEDTDDDYTYRNFHLKFKQEVSERLSYDISSFIYDKDYNSKDSLDNISRIFKTNWSYYLNPAPVLICLAGRLEYKEKRYDNAPIREYDQIRVAPTLTFSRQSRDPAVAGKKKDIYTVNVTCGINNFNYLQAQEKDQLKIFGELGGKRYLLEKKLMLTSAYKIETTEQKKINRQRTKHNLMGGFDYIFGLPWIYKIDNRLEWGQRDTKEEEEPFDSLRSLRANTELVEVERDEDFDYEYWRYYTKTEHRLSPKLKTALKYQYFKKDYISADLDHRGFYIRNDWDYEVLDNKKQRLWLDFGAEHKDVQYNLKSGNDYQKETLEIKATYQRKKNYKLQAALEQNFYDFDVKGNDKKRTYVKLSGEKLFFEGDLVLSLDLKYRYTDYEQKEDKKDEAVRIAFKYRF